MHNKVAHTLARSFLNCEFATLRFNFRGTEGSEGSFDDGVGERDDAIAAIGWMRTRYAKLPLWLASSPDNRSTKLAAVAAGSNSSWARLAW